uniref:Uncharacterized protein n=1 Tax=Panagrolaimus sp. JU765 TaxID=591449 RepID=A0AC34R4Y7_9BILA
MYRIKKRQNLDGESTAATLISGGSAAQAQLTHHQQQIIQIDARPEAPHQVLSASEIGSFRNFQTLNPDVHETVFTVFSPQESCCIESREQELEDLKRLKLEYLEKKRKSEIELARENKALKDKLIQVEAEKKKKDDEIVLLLKGKVEADEKVSHLKSECIKNQVNCASLMTQVQKLTERSDKLEKDFENTKEQKERYEKQNTLTSEKNPKKQIKEKSIKIINNFYQN